MVCSTIQRVEDIEMKFHLTEIKPIHANWTTQFYNHMSMKDGLKVVINRWKRSGIVDAVTNGPAALPSIDTFQNIAPPLPSTSDACESETISPTEVTEDFVNLRLPEMTMILIGNAKMTTSVERPSILLSMTMANDSLILIFLSILSVVKIFFCCNLLMKTF